MTNDEIPNDEKMQTKRTSADALLSNLRLTVSTGLPKRQSVSCGLLSPVGNS